MKRMEELSRKILSSQKGLTMLEILIGFGILSILALLGTTLLKNVMEGQVGFEEQMDRHSLVRMAELHLRSSKGCADIIGKKVGDPLEIKFGGEIMKAGSKFAGTKVKKLEFARFIPINQSGTLGLAEVLVSTTSKNKTRGIDRTFPVSVQLKDAGGVKTISSCNTGAGTSIQDLADKICAQAYGAVSAGMSCADVVAALHMLTNDAICADLYGTINPKLLINGQCDLSAVHNDKVCEADGQYVAGFDDTGKAICAGSLPPPNCKAGTKNWSSNTPAGQAKCTQSIGAGVPGDLVNLKDTIGPETGNKTFVCDNGSWKPQSGGCTKPCDPNMGNACWHQGVGKFVCSPGACPSGMWVFSVKNCYDNSPSQKRDTHCDTFGGQFGPVFACADAPGSTVTYCWEHRDNVIECDGSCGGFSIHPFTPHGHP